MNLPVDPRIVRQMIIEQAKKANVGHIGSALSVVEILISLYGGPLQSSDDTDPLRNRFVLSKGHAALALYVILCLKGKISKQMLETYCQDGSLLGTHPEHHVQGIDFSTGSLGHGLSMGAGAALAAALQKDQRKTFVLLSDAECNEGSVWEAVMFAAHHRLSNLVAIIDLNGQQAFGTTEKVLNISPQRSRWEAFGWKVYEVDGHSLDELNATLMSLNTCVGGSPHVILARTRLGKGVSFMEGKLKWHYWPLSDEECAQALAELGKEP